MPKRTTGASDARVAIRASLPLPLKRLLATVGVLGIAALFACIASEWSLAAAPGVDDSVSVQIRKWTAPPVAEPSADGGYVLGGITARGTTVASSAYSDVADFCDGGSTSTATRCVSVSGGIYAGPPACCDGADEEDAIRFRRSPPTARTCGDVAGENFMNRDVCSGSTPKLRLSED